MRKLLTLILVIAMVSAIALTGCGSSKPAATDTGKTDALKYADGVYFAQEDEFASNGYKYFAVITVNGGKITDAYWGGTNVVPAGNKRILSMEGKYKMGGAAEWYEQAIAAEKWLIENQDPAKFKYTDDEGHTDILKTDAGAQVSIHVKEFYTLAKKALESKPVPAGQYVTPKDYVATSSLDPDDKGWKYMGEFIVVNGTIVDVLFNSPFTGEFNDANAKYFKKGADGKPDPTKPSSKLVLKMDYGMNWFEQAQNSADYIVKNQGFPVQYKDDQGHTDSIAGVSIHVIEFEELFKKALQKK
ncbi:MAG: hypothetical protein GX285_06575 [Clostridiales bacterium]|nr:hypothetical protein [Clostridiales bacterium]